MTSEELGSRYPLPALQKKNTVSRWENVTLEWMIEKGAKRYAWVAPGEMNSDEPSSDLSDHPNLKGIAPT
jgi:hypothetical protein